MNDETENDPGYAHTQEAHDILVAECEDAYAVLDELEEQLSEACEEQTTWGEEIDRQNLRKLLDDIDAVQRVKLLIMEIVDPHGPPSTDDPIPPGGAR